MTDTAEKKSFEPLFSVIIDDTGYTDVKFFKPSFINKNCRGCITASVIKRAMRSITIKYRQYRRLLAKERRIEEKKMLTKNTEIKNAS